MPDTPKLILAPFKGLTNKTFRNAFAKHIGGFDEMIAPFISGSGEHRINNSKLTDLIPKESNLVETTPQCLSTSAKEIALLAKTLSFHGYDHLNWNLGCPFTRIAEKLRGCGILPYPTLLDHILEEVFSTISTKLSIKTRLGYQSPEEILKIVDVLNKYPIHAITIHARTGKQLYRGEVNHEAFEQARRRNKHTTIYNGDIYNLLQFEKNHRLFPTINNWMLGRGALMNPFLPLEIKGISPGTDEKRERLHAFHQELMTTAQQEVTQQRKWLGWMKAIWYYLSGTFDNGREIFSRIKKTTNASDYKECVSYALEQPFSDPLQQEHYFVYGIKHL